MGVSDLEVARLLPAAGQMYGVARNLKIIGVDEVGGAAADHLFRIVAQDRRGTRADPNELTIAIRDYDQIHGYIENTSALFHMVPALPPLRRKYLGNLSVQFARQLANWEIGHHVLRDVRSRSDRET